MDPYAFKDEDYSLNRPNVSLMEVFENIVKHSQPCTALFLFTSGDAMN